MLKAWDDYDLEKESENDDPRMFNTNQLFVVIEDRFAGIALEDFEFVTASQAESVFLQVILSMNNNILTSLRFGL